MSTLNLEIVAIESKASIRCGADGRPTFVYSEVAELRNGEKLACASDFGSLLTARTFQENLKDGQLVMRDYWARLGTTKAAP